MSDTIATRIGPERDPTSDATSDPIQSDLPLKFTTKSDLNVNNWKRWLVLPRVLQIMYEHFQ
jgi:hypothetical protein